MMNKALLAGASAAGALSALVLAMTVPSVANATAAVSDGNCSTSDVSPTAGACSGFYAGNQLGSGGDMDDTQAAALAALGFVGPVTLVQHLDFSDGTVEFNSLLSGTTYIGIHWGKGGGPTGDAGGATAFYRLDLASDANLAVINVGFGAWSGASLYSTQPCVGAGCDNGGNGGVPEPATWAMMIMGFGGVGSMIRRRRESMVLAK